jgi:hypothetical protein
MTALAHVKRCIKRWQMARPIHGTGISSGCEFGILVCAADRTECPA